MAVYSGKQVADNRTLKRPFSAVNKSGYEITEVQIRQPSIIQKPRVVNCSESHMESPIIRTEPQLNALSKMPIAAGPQALQSQIPSFASSYGYDAAKSENTLVESPQEVTGAEISDRSGLDGAPPFSHLQHKHRDSTSTQTSASTDSSPTTTISTTDSSALTDPSPSSSPESPVTILPLSCFSSSGFSNSGFGVHSLDDLTMMEVQSLKPDGDGNHDRPMTSPTSKKIKNSKKLALNLGSPETTAQMSAPASPLPFMRPPPPKPRRMGSTLSLQTSTNLIATSQPALAMEPPPTPGFRLQLSTASFRNPSGLMSPDPRRGGPPGGMRLPAFERSQTSGLSNAFRPIGEITPGGSQEPGNSMPSIIRSQVATRNDNDIGGDTFDRGEHKKEASYPDGPIAIYPPNVYLYSEPTAEEASQFDVVFNVARELVNPFEAAANARKRQSSVAAAFDAMDIDRENIPEPMTGATMDSFRTAFETLPGNSATSSESSPSTPRAVSKRIPEYIHMSWDHRPDNNFATELMALCEQIHRHDMAGKKILVHCQQGVSRSASLIIAYGVYKNPTLTVEEASNAAKKRSPWIDPNMFLFFGLEEFRKLTVANAPRSSPIRQKHTRMTMSVDESLRNFSTPQTAPLLSGERGPLDEPRNLAHTRGISAPNLRDISSVVPAAENSTEIWAGTSQDPVQDDTLVPTPTRAEPMTDFELMPPPSEPSQGPPVLQLSAPPKKKCSPTRKSAEKLELSASPEKASPVKECSKADIPAVQKTANTDASAQLEPQPVVEGFAAHRAKHKQAPTPILSVKPEQPQPTRTAPSLPLLASNTAVPQFATSLFDPPTPGFMSPRKQEMAAPSIAPSLGSNLGLGTNSMNNSAFAPDPPGYVRPAFLPSRGLNLGSITSPRTEEFLPRPMAPLDPALLLRPDWLDPPPPKAGFFGSIRGMKNKLLKKPSFMSDKKEKGLKPLPPLPNLPPTNAQMGGVEKAIDPRSPAMKGESGIVRSIDDMMQ